MSTGATHVAAGVLFGLATSYITKYFSPHPAFYCGVGALLSDFDSRKSTISSLFPFVAIPVDALTKHRGVLHWGTPILLLFIYLYTKYPVWLWLSIGSASHLLLDVITKKLGITCNSMGERMLYRLIWIINIGMIVNIADPDMIGRIIETVKEWMR